MSSERTGTVLAVGELLWDRFADSRRPGGAPANVVYHTSRLGRAAKICSRVGADADGDELLGLLRERGVDVSLVQRDSERPTGSVTVDSDDPSSPSYTIHEGVAWDAIEATVELERAAADCAALCVGTLAQRCETSRTTIRRCLERAAQALTVYDVNLRPPFCERAWIEQTLKAVRVVKLNSGEAGELSTLLDLGATDDLGFARAAVERYGVETVCITRGGDGCAIVGRDAVHEVGGEPVDVVDTVGAGDAFTAALVDGLLHGRDPERVARDANRLGARVAARAGAMPDLDEGST